MKTDNPIACVMVNCKLCKSAIALCCLQVRVGCISVNKSNHPIQIPSVVSKTRDNMFTLVEFEVLTAVFMKKFFLLGYNAVWSIGSQLAYQRRHVPS
jgi:hypothetical protein